MGQEGDADARALVFGPYQVEPGAARPGLIHRRSSCTVYRRTAAAGDHRRGPRRTAIGGLGSGRGPPAFPETASLLLFDSPWRTGRYAPLERRRGARTDRSSPDLLAYRVRGRLRSSLRLSEKARASDRWVPGRAARTSTTRGSARSRTWGSRCAEKVRSVLETGRSPEFKELRSAGAVGRPRHDRDPRVRPEEGDGRVPRSSDATASR